MLTVANSQVLYRKIRNAWGDELHRFYPASIRDDSNCVFISLTFLVERDAEVVANTIKQYLKDIKYYGRYIITIHVMKIVVEEASFIGDMYE